MWDFINNIQNFDLNEVFKYFVDGITFEVFLKFLVIYFTVVWIAILAWVIKDITNRTNSIILQFISILIVLLFTPLGIFIYLIIRPSRTVFEKYYLEIEENLETFSNIIEDKILNDNEKIHCYKCKTPIGPDFKFCPKCKIELKWDCESCWKHLYKWWKICPYCGKKQK